MPSLEIKVMNLLAPIVRPLFTWKHEQVMQGRV